MTRATPEDGFTLVELLVALGLLSLLTLYGLNAITTLREMDRAGRQIEQGAEVEAVARHLTHTIADARTVLETVDGRPQIIFEGRADRTLVTASDDALETGGLYRVTYTRDDAGQLVTRRQLYRQGSTPAERQFLLLDRVAMLQFRYFGALEPRADPRWTATWPLTNALPRLVEISLSFPQGDARRWPKLVTRIEGARQ